MTTALTAYLSSLASSTLTTAGATPTTTGAGTVTGNTTAIGGATGWGEVPALGSTAAWAAHLSQDGPSGKGWLLDPNTLDGQTLLTGNWTPTLRFAGGNFSADIYVRAYVYTAGTYTLIGSMSLLNQTFTTTNKTYTFSATSLSAAAIPTGSHLYLDVWLYVTSNSSGPAATIKISLSSSSTQGNTTAQVVTPGYATTVNTLSLVTTCAGSATLAGPLTLTSPPGIFLVQSAAGSTGGSNATSAIVTTQSTGVGHLLLAGVTVVGSSPTITPPAGWIQIGSSVAFSVGTGLLAYYLKANTSGGATSFTFSFSTACNASVSFEEWNGLSTTAPLEQFVSHADDKQTQSTTGTTNTLGLAGELAVWCLGFGAIHTLSYSNSTNGYSEDSASAAASSQSSSAQTVFFYNTTAGTAPTSSSVTKSDTGSTGSATLLAVFVPISALLVAECDGQATLTGVLPLTRSMVGEVDGVGTLGANLGPGALFIEFDGTSGITALWFPVALFAEMDGSGVLAWAITLVPAITKSLDGFGDVTAGLRLTATLVCRTDARGSITGTAGYLGISGALFGGSSGTGSFIPVLQATYACVSTLVGQGSMSITAMQRTVALTS